MDKKFFNRWGRKGSAKDAKEIALFAKNLARLAVKYISVKESLTLAQVSPLCKKKRLRASLSACAGTHIQTDWQLPASGY